MLSAQSISSRSFNQQEHIKNESYSSEQPFPQFTIKDIDKQRQDYLSLGSPEDKKQQIRSKSVSKNNIEPENSIFQVAIVAFVKSKEK